MGLAWTTWRETLSPLALHTHTQEKVSEYDTLVTDPFTAELRFCMSTDVGEARIHTWVLGDKGRVFEI